MSITDADANPSRPSPPAPPLPAVAAAAHMRSMGFNDEPATMSGIARTRTFTRDVVLECDPIASTTDITDQWETTFVLNDIAQTGGFDVIDRFDISLDFGQLGLETTAYVDCTGSASGGASGATRVFADPPLPASRCVSTGVCAHDMRLRLRYNPATVLRHLVHSVALEVHQFATDPAGEPVVRCIAVLPGCVLRATATDEDTALTVHVPFFSTDSFPLTAYREYFAMHPKLVLRLRLRPIADCLRLYGDEVSVGGLPCRVVWTGDGPQHARPPEGKDLRITGVAAISQLDPSSRLRLHEAWASGTLSVDIPTCTMRLHAIDNDSTSDLTVEFVAGQRCYAVACSIDVGTPLLQQVHVRVAPHEFLLAESKRYAGRFVVIVDVCSGGDREHGDGAVAPQFTTKSTLRCTADFVPGDESYPDHQWHFLELRRVAWDANQCAHDVPAVFRFV